MNIKIQDDILILRFKNNHNMNKILDPISNVYEGVIINRIGHNFPIEFVPENHILSTYKKSVKYVIAISNFKNLKHEMLHAKYYLDKTYRDKIIDEFNSLDQDKRSHIQNVLTKMSYPEDKWIDEYQAYTYSEKDNFWGLSFKS
jgi:hypothetical protein